VEFEDAPPYRVKRTATFTPEALRETLARAEERLQRRLDEWPRPHLCDGGPACIEGFGPQRPGPQHAALWFRGRELFERRTEILSSLDARLDLDPYATLDVVLAQQNPFPLDLVELIRKRLDAAPQSYASRALAHRGEDLQRRMAVVLGDDFDREWVDALREHAQVFRDQPVRAALRDAARLGDDLPGARIVGEVPSGALRELARTAEPDLVCFSDQRLERAWQQGVLGFADVRPAASGLSRTARTS